MKIPDLAQPERGWELLVSVRSLAEADCAAVESVDILDFKEPLHGPLAPVASELWHEAAARFANPPTGPIQLSAALGEQDTARRIAEQVPASFAFAKAGPSGCRSASELSQMWQHVRGSLAPSVELVAVAYADADAAQTLEPEEIVGLASEHGFRRILVDTFTKDGRSSVEQLQLPRLRELRRLTSARGLRWMLAGSIQLQHLDGWLAAETQPDAFGVRGDVCCSGRESEIVPERIRAWRERLEKRKTI